MCVFVLEFLLSDLYVSSHILTYMAMRYLALTIYWVQNGDIIASEMYKHVNLGKSMHSEPHIVALFNFSVGLLSLKRITREWQSADRRRYLFKVWRKIRKTLCMTFLHKEKCFWLVPINCDLDGLIHHQTFIHTWNVAWCNLSPDARSLRMYKELGFKYWTDSADDLAKN